MSIETTVRSALAGLHEDIDKRLPAIIAAAQGAESSPVVEALEDAVLGPVLEAKLAALIAEVGAQLHPVDPASLPNVHFFGGPAGEPVSTNPAGDTVTVADQRAAGVAPEDTVTVADQRAGVPVVTNDPPPEPVSETVPAPVFGEPAEAAGGREFPEPEGHTTTAALP